MRPDSLSQALDLLRAEARPHELAGMARFGMNVAQPRLGVSVPTLRCLGKQLGRDHALALALWDSGIADAQILASLVAEPARFTAREMDHWAQTLQSWDTCDQACSNAFSASPLAWRKVAAWATKRDEFVRRAAFALLAALVVHDKAADDAAFIATLPLIEDAATDERNFVKKAVNWALRSIGKRNPALNAEAIACAQRLQTLDSRAARWVAADALRELQSEAVQTRLAARR
ncbi:MAG: DNA alkylation repair protein [Rhizobacter sp.]